MCGAAYVPADGGVLGDGGTCVKKTCADYGANCGPVADGCGGLTASCGTCTAPYICGGSGTANVCGNPYADDAGVVCKPRTCADLGATCGWIGDGCGGTAFCGTCTAPEICGGGGVPSQCGGGGGTSTSCTDPLCAKIPVCGAGTETTISGTVYAPNGVQPLYNAVVYIPKDAVAPFGETISCDRCDTPRSAFATAVTGPDGKFTLKGAIPAGANIPLVIELGRWRRFVWLSNVSACVANPLAATLTRLPRRQGEGHPYDNIPRMAIATGNVDALECVLRKVGLEDSVFSDPNFTDTTKRIHFYKDNGAQYSTGTPSWTTLSSDLNTMRKYDAIIYACRGSEGTARATTDKANLRQYANEGGRVFATHFSYMWLIDNDIWATAASWLRNGGMATSSDTTPLVSDVNTSFPKGLAFSQWLGIVGALSTTSPPRVDILAARKDVIAAVDPSLAWITSASPTTTQHMTFNTPFKAATTSLCGRVLFSDFHVTNASTSGVTFPAECNTNPLTAQEKVLEFMLFDLASCVSGDGLPPPTPPTCTPRTCADAGASCGQVADGCGGLTASCGTCPVGQTCGGGGTPGVCGGPTCVPKTCADLGYDCGLAGNGCGGVIDCGTCTAPGDTCGGGGIAGKCGHPTTTCTPRTCAELGLECGPAGDGCGNLLNCGTCVPPATCGGGGVPGKCGAPSCTPTTCSKLGYDCGLAADGCGGTLDCGTCVSPSVCGGDGIANHCSVPPR